MRKPMPMSEVLQELEESTEIELPMDPTYYDRLHSRIMMAVERSTDKPTVPLPRPWPETAWTPAAAPVSRNKSQVL